MGSERKISFVGFASSQSLASYRSGCCPGGPTESELSEDNDAKEGCFQT